MLLTLVHVGFAVDIVELGQGFLRLFFLVFPCQYHSVVAPHTRVSSGAGVLEHLSWSSTTVDLRLASEHRHKMSVMTSAGYKEVKEHCPKSNEHQAENP
jgi:hypothetical protein